MLKPNLLSFVQGKFTTADEFSNYLSQLNRLQPDHLLFSTENWLCLSVQQPNVPGKPGCQTFWAGISPAAILEAGASSEGISTGIVNFFQAWAEADLAESSQQNPLNTIEEIVDVLKDLADFGNALANPSSKISTQEDQLSDMDLQPPMGHQRILEEAIRFFAEDDWSFAKIQGQPALQIGCQGKNGEWNCYAKAREEQQQFIFYSISPIAAPEDKRGTIAHFLTRANYGTLIGNFELDFSDGEIRYKTSIDVEGDRLTPALIKRLVYTNVAMMDEYLPGIQAVMAGETPEQAIALVEH
ncbi:MAG: YbjN domain-containing protein [Synechococcales bacterium]|nr:YbjN domain-containing protein [Synechococcales bacterium]